MANDKRHRPEDGPTAREILGHTGAVFVVFCGIYACANLLGHIVAASEGVGADPVEVALATVVIKCIIALDWILLVAYVAHSFLRLAKRFVPETVALYLTGLLRIVRRSGDHENDRGRARPRWRIRAFGAIGSLVVVALYLTGSALLAPREWTLLFDGLGSVFETVHGHVVFRPGLQSDRIWMGFKVGGPIGRPVGADVGQTDPLDTSGRVTVWCNTDRRELRITATNNDGTPITRAYTIYDPSWAVRTSFQEYLQRFEEHMRGDGGSGPTRKRGAQAAGSASARQAARRGFAALRRPFPMRTARPPAGVAVPVWPFGHQPPTGA
jgi:hypothetical protein